MKSIKQQYIDLQEGKMSQANFMRSLRMTMPQYVTNVTSYNDSVRILKNKGILSEADIRRPDEDDDIPAIYRMYNSDAWVDAQKDAGESSEYDDEKNIDGEDDYDADYEEPNEPFGMDESLDLTQAEEIAKAAGSYESAVDELVSMGLSPKAANDVATDVYGEEDVPEEEYNPEDYGGMSHDDYENSLDHDNWLNEAQAIKGNNSKDLYTQFKEIDNLNGQEVLIGIDFEMEKNPELTKAAAAKIVVKNLKKNPIYYTSSLMAGKEGYEPQYMNKFKPGADQMQELSKDNAIDKENGMKPVKDIEKIKASANKAKKETNTAEKGISLMSLIAKSVRGVQKMNATGEKMKKIVMKEGMEGQYTFNGYFKGGELDKLKTMIPDAEIDDQVEYGQGAKTTVLSQQHSDEEIKKAVDSVIGMNEDKVASTIFDKNANITKGVNDIAKGKLTKERLKELIRQEIAGAYGGDSMDPEDGSSYTND
jgi:hypothetical protein